MTPTISAIYGENASKFGVPRVVAELAHILGPDMCARMRQPFAIDSYGGTDPILAVCTRVVQVAKTSGMDDMDRSILITCSEDIHGREIPGNELSALIARGMHPTASEAPFFAASLLLVLCWLSKEYAQQGNHILRSVPRRGVIREQMVDHFMKSAREVLLATE